MVRLHKDRRVASLSHLHQIRRLVVAVQSAGFHLTAPHDEYLAADAAAQVLMGRLPASVKFAS